MTRLVALLVFVLGISIATPVHAAESFPSRDQAWAACLAKANQLTADALPSNPNAPYQCVLDFAAPGGATGQYCVATKTGTELCSFSYAWTAGCPSGKVWNDLTKECQTPCGTRPDQTGGFTPPNGSISCQNGCEVAYFYNGDGTSTGKTTGAMCKNPPTCGAGYYWNATLNVCSPIEPEECEDGVTPKEGVCKPKEECPTGMHTDDTGACKPDANECPAGKTKAPDGSCTGDDGSCAAGSAKGKDGTCKPDANGDGTPDDEDEDPGNDPEKNEFSGGDDCRTPPTCSGDPVMCGQARIQWRIECNTRRNENVTGGGDCNVAPQCSGEKCSAMDQAMLTQQWRTACSTKQVVAGIGNGNGGDGEAPEPGEYLGEDEAAPPIKEVGEQFEGDRSGFGWSRTCPQIPTVEVFGHTIAFDTSVVCNWMAIGGWFVLLVAGWRVLRILSEI